MERRPTRTRTMLAGSMLALTPIAPWTLAQDPDYIVELRRPAEQGDTDAQFELGFRYNTGVGVLQDDAEAARWLRLAAEQGHARAQFNLGFMYDGFRYDEDAVVTSSSAARLADVRDVAPGRTAHPGARPARSVAFVPSQVRIGTGKAIMTT